MVVATLGNVIFEVYDGKIFTPKGISGSTGSDWATHDVVHGKTTREWIGPRTAYPRAGHWTNCKRWRRATTHFGLWWAAKQWAKTRLC